MFLLFNITIAKRFGLLLG